MKLPRTESTKLNLFMFIVIGVRPAKLSSSKMLCNHVLSHHKVENRVKIFHSVLQPSFDLLLNEILRQNLFHNALQSSFDLP